MTATLPWQAPFVGFGAAPSFSGTQGVPPAVVPVELATLLALVPFPPLDDPSLDDELVDDVAEAPPLPSFRTIVQLVAPTIAPTIAQRIAEPVAWRIA